MRRLQRYEILGSDIETIRHDLTEAVKGHHCPLRDRPAQACRCVLTKKGRGGAGFPSPSLSPINCNPSAYFATTAPPGVGAGRGEFLKPGDVVKLWIEKIGSLTNTMV
jgi:hypothetical protein